MSFHYCNIIFTIFVKLTRCFEDLITDIRYRTRVETHIPMNAHGNAITCNSSKDAQRNRAFCRWRYNDDISLTIAEEQAFVLNKLLSINLWRRKLRLTDAGETLWWSRLHRLALGRSVDTLTRLSGTRPQVITSVNVIFATLTTGRGQNVAFIATTALGIRWVMRTAQ